MGVSATRRTRHVHVPVHGILGAICVVVGEVLVIAHHRPLSDYYFPFAWLGYILVLDAAIAAATGNSLWTTRRPLFLALFPISSVFWWIFEWMNLAVHNWIYVGTGPYTGLRYVAFATVDFSFVLPAVWSSACLVRLLLPTRKEDSRTPGIRLPQGVPPILLALGLLSLVLPVLWPRYAFPLIWVSLYFLLDPINLWLGRPSIIRAVQAGDWRTPVSCALGTIVCGLFWEGWNEWAMPKWTYDIPFVGYWHIFQMPLLGWMGYLPFGLELFAMTNFVLPFLGLGGLTPDDFRLEKAPQKDEELGAA